jgi:hypothetical protein
MAVGFFGKLLHGGSKLSKVSPTIKSVSPFVPKNKKETLARDLRRSKQYTKASQTKFDNTLFRIEQESKKLKDMKTEKKAKGGRVGLKRGTPKRQTNIQKIQKTFGNNKLGMQSVIYGLDKNKNVTKADPKAKFIAAANKKKKKKVI